MAKKSTGVKVAQKSPEMLAPAVVTRDTTEAEVIAYEKEGRELSFAGGEQFKVLPDALTKDLSHENAKRYWVALGEHRAEGKRSTPRPLVERIIDPLVGHEGARLEYKARGAEGIEFLKRNHLSWQFCTNADGFKQLGYNVVSDEDPVDVGISSNASHHYLTKDLQGRDELLLMKVDMKLHEQHTRAVAALSQQKVRGARGQFEAELDQATKGKVKPSPETEEDQTVEKVRVTRDTVNQAFLKK